MNAAIINKQTLGKFYFEFSSTSAHFQLINVFVLPFEFLHRRVGARK